MTVQYVQGVVIGDENVATAICGSVICPIRSKPNHRVDAIVMALAGLKYVGASQLEYRIRVGFVTTVAQIGKGLPQKRIQFDRLATGLVGQCGTLGFRANLRNELQSKTGNVTKFLANFIQMLRAEGVVIYYRVL